MDKNRAMLYVSCKTFNQAQYIEETLNGFCMQQTDFPFVCGIFDDSSTDGEQLVIKNYLEENFNLDASSVYRSDETDDYVRVFAQHKSNKNCFFVVLFLKYNHYQLKKAKDPYTAEWSEKAKYMSICEGDDYWIDPLKLQKQVNYLENHESCGLVYTKAKIFSETEKQFTGYVGGRCSSFTELLLKNTVPTLTIMCRSDIYQRYYDEVEPSKRGWKMGDYPIWLYIAANNDIHFINEVTAVYRLLPDSASHSSDYQVRLTFISSSYAIRLFFANYYGLGDEVKRNIEDYYWREQTYVLRGKDKKLYKYALKRIRNKTIKERIKFILPCFYLFF